MIDCFVLCSLVTSSLCDETRVWRVDRVCDEFTGSPRRRCLGMSQTFGQRAHC